MKKIHDQNTHNAFRDMPASDHITSMKLWVTDENSNILNFNHFNLSLEIEIN